MATLEDVLKQIFEVRAKPLEDLSQDDLSPEVELSSLKKKRLPLLILQRNGSGSDLAVIPLGALLALLQHALRFALLRRLQTAHKAERRKP